MNKSDYGPKTKLGQEIHEQKYRTEGETFYESVVRWCQSLKDNDEHFHKIKEIGLEQRFLPAGRVQRAMGSPHAVTPYNCYVSGTIADDMKDIMAKQGEAVETLRMGGGIGYDFSTLRPRGSLIRSLQSVTSGPLAFMDGFNAWCGTISSAGHRRGAQMGVLRVDHPDIEEFVTSKTNQYRLSNFNISVAVTDEFMQAVKDDTMFDLRFEGTVYKTVNARALWYKILRTTWDWSEPGVLFIDRMNSKNNLWYCETIAATNPCGEQPLPPYGACLLGSFNLTKYIRPHYITIPVTDEGLGPEEQEGWEFDWDQFKHDIPYIVRAMDNVVDRAIYPLEEQRTEATNKRRMGLGVTGLANTAEILGFPYASEAMKQWTEEVLTTLRDSAYWTSVELAMEKGPFPLYDERYLDSAYTQTLPDNLRDAIRNSGIRNSHLLSVAPTGTISLTADNVSSGLEPPFSLQFERKVKEFDGIRSEIVQDYAYANYGVEGRTALDLSVSDHVDMLNLVSGYVDSACSKTVNVGTHVTWDEFCQVYMDAYEGGASGCTTHREGNNKTGILTASKDEEVVEEETHEETFVNETDGVNQACTWDPLTGQRDCE